MSFSPLEIEVLLQIAMAIGSAGELGPMLRNSLSTTMRKLDCATGSVWRYREQAAAASGAELIFSIPRNLLADSDYQQLMQQLQQRLQSGSLPAFHAQLPLRLQLAGEQMIYVFELPNFGLLLLGKFGEPLPERIVQSLPPLVEKLARACQFCLQQELVQQTNQELQAAQRELQVAHDLLEQRVDERTAEMNRANEELQLEILERHRAEEALRASEEIYRTIFEHAGAGLNIISPEGVILRVNPAFCRILG